MLADVDVDSAHTLLHVVDGSVASLVVVVLLASALRNVLSALVFCHHHHNFDGFDGGIDLAAAVVGGAVVVGAVGAGAAASLCSCRWRRGVSVI